MTARKGPPPYGRQDLPDPYVRLLVRARVRNGLTQKQVGKHIGVSAAMVCQWESGRKKMYPCQESGYALFVGVAERSSYQAARDKIAGIDTIKVVSK